MLQILAASFTKVEFRMLHPWALFNWLESADLVLLFCMTSFLLDHLSGCWSESWDFHTSNSLICALIWFTGGNFSSLNICLVGILFISLFPFKNLASLFWATQTSANNSTRLAIQKKLIIGYYSGLNTGWIRGNNSTRVIFESLHQKSAFAICALSLADLLLQARIWTGLVFVLHVNTILGSKLSFNLT